MEIKDRLKLLRLKSGLTLVQLSKKTGIAQSTLSRYETGIRKPTKIEQINRLANVFNVDPAYIAGISEKENDLFDEDLKTNKINADNFRDNFESSMVSKHFKLGANILEGTNFNYSPNEIKEIGETVSTYLIYRGNADINGVNLMDKFIQTVAETYSYALSIDDEIIPENKQFIDNAITSAIEKLYSVINNLPTNDDK